MSSQLFITVAGLLAASMVTGAIGAWVGQAIKSMIAWIGLLILYIVGVFIVMAASHAAPPVAIGVMLGWTFLSGLVLAPALHMYVEQLGWQTVVGAFGGTAGVMAICGCIGALSGINFSGMGTFLMFALIGLIVVGLISMFVRMSREVNIVWSIFGMLIFSGYFIFDFFRLSKAENTLPNAIDLTLNLYLDFINFFLYLLQFLAAISDKH